MIHNRIFFSIISQQKIHDFVRFIIGIGNANGTDQPASCRRTDMSSNF
jgi:hypothetical protein